MKKKLYTLVALLTIITASSTINLSAYHGNGYHHHHGGHAGAVTGGIVGGALVGGAIAASAAANTATQPIDPYYYNNPDYVEEYGYYEDGPVYVNETTYVDQNSYARQGRYHDTRAPRTDSNKRIPAQKHVTETGRESKNSNLERKKNK